MNRKLFTFGLTSAIILSACYQVGSSSVNETSVKIEFGGATANSLTEQKNLSNLDHRTRDYPEPHRQLQLKKTASSSPENGNCSSRSIHDFPEDPFTGYQRAHGAAILHLLFGFYCFALTAYVCTDYLLPALDVICADLRISPNVAGATFLATASCFPELFVNVVGTFVTESDLGVGDVVGGAVFNTFATPAFGALSAAQGIKLEWQILSRDCIIYVISVGTLVEVMWDGLITWYEATILMALFTAYFTFLFLHDAFCRWINRIGNKFRKDSTLKPATAQINWEHGNMPFGLYKPFVHGELVVEYRNSIKRARKLNIIENGINPNSSQELSPIEEYVEPDFPFTGRPSGTFFQKAWFVVTWPIKILLFLTIPDTRYKKLRNWYPLTFIMCIMWIAVSSYLVSWMMTVVGDTLGIADSIMGITFLAAGGNMPELVSIVILSRQGNGDMAMSNTLGGNTLDVLLCLGLPWIIRTQMTGNAVKIESGALAYSVISIIPCVIGFYAVTAYNDFTLNKKVGVACLVMYSLFLTSAILMEANFFFPVNFPMCAD